jgi:hypothetical protein
MSKYVILMLMIEVMVMANRFLPTDNEIQQENHENSVNQKNSQEFQNLMDHSKKTYDDYWDINNPVIRIILIILFIIIVLGAGYYFVMWFR